MRKHGVHNSDNIVSNDYSSSSNGGSFTRNIESFEPIEKGTKRAYHLCKEYAKAEHHKLRGQCFNVCS